MPVAVLTVLPNQQGRLPSWTLLKASVNAAVARDAVLRYVGLQPHEQHDRRAERRSDIADHTDTLDCTRAVAIFVSLIVAF